PLSLRTGAINRPNLVGTVIQDANPLTGMEIVRGHFAKPNYLSISNIDRVEAITAVMPLRLTSPVPKIGKLPLLFGNTPRSYILPTTREDKIRVFMSI